MNRNVPRPFIHATLIVTVALALCASVWAQDPVRVQNDSVPRVRQNVRVQAAPADAVPVMRVSPQTEQSPEAKEAASFVVAPAAPLTPAAKLKALAPTPPPSAGGNVAAKPDPKLTSIMLTPREPYRHNRGYLKFNETRHTDTNENYVYWHYPQNKTMGYAQAHLNVEKGKRYLVDTIVSCKGEQTFQYGLQKVTLQEGTHHLLLILEPEFTGWTSVTMWNDERWAFYSMEVTLVE